MAKFDGQTGISVPESVLPSETFPPHKFTIATWMRHRDNKALDKHTKEHIICKADDHRKYFILLTLVKGRTMLEVRCSIVRSQK